MERSTMNEPITAASPTASQPPAPSAGASKPIAPANDLNVPTPLPRSRENSIPMIRTLVTMLAMPAPKPAPVPRAPATDDVASAAATASYAVATFLSTPINFCAAIPAPTMPTVKPVTPDVTRSSQPCKIVSTPINADLTISPKLPTASPAAFHRSPQSPRSSASAIMKKSVITAPILFNTPAMPSTPDWTALLTAGQYDIN